MHQHSNRIGLRFLAPALAAACGLPLGAAEGQQDQQFVLEGEVDGFKTVRLSEDGQRERGLMRIRLENGRSAIVDLGDQRDAQRLELESGDQVRITGSKTRIGDQTVLEAQRVQVDGQRPLQQQAQQQRPRQQQAQRQQQQGQQQQGQQQQRQARLSGSVERSKQLGQQGRLLLIETRDGDQRVVHIPAQWKLSDQQLQRSKQIDIIGAQRQIQGQQVLSAQRIRLDGREIQPGQQQGQQQQRQQPQDQRRAQMQQRMRQHHQQMMQQKGQGQQDQRRAQMQQRMRQQQGQQQQGQQQQGQQQRTAKIQGTVAGFKQVRLQGAPEDNLFARIQLQDGQSRIVDLGEVSKAKVLQISQGDRIEIEGKLRRLGEQRVLEARHVQVQSQQQQGQGQQQRQGQQRREMMRSGIETVKGQSIMLQGQVEDIQKVQVQGQQGQVGVMKIRLQDGTSQILNLSPWLAKDFLEIEPGDHIVASGTERQTQGGKSVVIVDGIVVVDEKLSRN